MACRPKRAGKDGDAKAEELTVDSTLEAFGLEHRHRGAGDVQQFAGDKISMPDGTVDENQPAVGGIAGCGRVCPVAGAEQVALGL